MAQSVEEFMVLKKWFYPNSNKNQRDNLLSKYDASLQKPLFPPDSVVNNLVSCSCKFSH